MTRLLAGLMIATFASQSFAITAEQHAAELEAWHQARVERLQRPDGWLSLVGLHWLEPGQHSLGSGADNAIVLSVGPARLGQISLQQGEVRFRPAEGVATVRNDLPVSGEVVLPADSSGEAVRLGFADGRASFQVIERSGRLGLRVRDAQAPNLLGFTRIERFPVDLSWRLEGRWIAHPAGKTIAIANVIGSLDPMPNPGAIEFERDGKRFRLEVVDEGDGSLFVIFADRTSGKQSYGAGRFLYAEPAGEGSVVIDFNRAYNPPCALNPYSTCPLPPPENRLDLAVTAGEMKYTGPHE